MTERDARRELEALVAQTGLSQAEARHILGLKAEGEDPLIDDTGPVSITFEEPEDSDLASLSKMFPAIPTSHITEVLEDTGGDIDKTTEELLSYSEIALHLEREQRQDAPEEDRPRGWHKIEKQKRKQQRKYEKRVMNEDEDIQVLVSVLKISEEAARSLYREYSGCVSDILKQYGEQPPPLTTKLVSETTNGSSTMASSRVLGGSTSVGFQSDMSDVSRYTTMHTNQLADLVDDTRARLKAALERRQAVLKNPNSRAVASDVSEAIRELRRKLRLMELALDSRFAVDKRTEHMRIDVHGCTLAQAKVIIGQALQKFRISKSPELEIVTGAGRHSATGQSVIKNWLRGYLQTQHVRNAELEGSFVLSKKVLV